MLAEHVGIELAQLVEQKFILALYVVGVAGHHEEQQRVALDVSEESKSETLALARALYNTGYVSHYERLVVTIVDDAERGFERCKRIVGYLWACARHGREQC